MYLPGVIPEVRAAWQVPEFESLLWRGREHPWSVVIPVINEGERIKRLLTRMSALEIESFADIIIIDGGSTDGSLGLDSLQMNGVRGFLLLKTGPGKLSAQLRCAYAFALDHGYEGIVTIDGNDKDDPEAILRFIDALKPGGRFCASFALYFWWGSRKYAEVTRFCYPLHSSPDVKLVFWFSLDRYHTGFSRIQPQNVAG